MDRAPHSRKREVRGGCRDRVEHENAAGGVVPAALSGGATAMASERSIPYPAIGAVVADDRGRGGISRPAQFGALLAPVGPYRCGTCGGTILPFSDGTACMLCGRPGQPKREAR